jgi:DivIVA domain-containing protein
MSGMDASQSALDSLRTVEFRETLKGYHRDDVDEYLEKAAVEAEGLQEQLRQSGERLRQAAERIAQLEMAIEQRPEQPVAEPAPPDDTLQRTLLLAQKFVDETKAESEAEAARVIGEANAKARMLTEQAQVQATQLAAESEQRLREEIGRLEVARSKLSHDVETMTRHLESERSRLRGALSEILRWVDENVQPESDQSGAHAEARPEGGGAPGPAPTAQPGMAASGNRPAAAPPQGPSPQHSGAPQSGEVTQMRPTGAISASPQAEASSHLSL